MDADIASFRRDDGPEGVCLVVAGELDESNAEEFRGALLELVDAARSPAILNLSEVMFFSSAGIRCLFAAKQRAVGRDVPLLIEPSPVVTRLLEITGLTEMFELHSTH